MQNSLNLTDLVNLHNLKFSEKEKENLIYVVTKVNKVSFLMFKFSFLQDLVFKSKKDSYIKRSTFLEVNKIQNKFNLKNIFCSSLVFRHPKFNSREDFPKLERIHSN